MPACSMLASRDAHCIRKKPNSEASALRHAVAMADLYGQVELSLKAKIRREKNETKRLDYSFRREVPETTQYASRADL